MASKRAPSHLLKATREWWASVLEKWELEQHHVRILTLAAEAWDRSTKCRRIIARQGLIVNDRYGQPRLHPAADEERRGKSLFSSLVKQLKLDLEDPGTVEDRKRVIGSKYWKGKNA